MTRLETIKNVPRKRKQMTYDELQDTLPEDAFD